MKGFTVLSIFLSCSVSLGQNFLFGKKTLTEINAAKSAYVKADMRYPLGEVVGSRLMWRLIENGFLNVTVEVPAQMQSPTSSQLYFGTTRPGEQQQLATFIKQAKSSNFSVVFKLVLIDYKKEFLGPVTPSDSEKFYELYRQFTGGYAKVAEKNNVAEIVLGSNLETLICEKPDLVRGLLRNLTRVYHGRVRFDSSSLSLAIRSKRCAEEHGLQFDGFGVDLRNPKLDEPNQVLASGFQISYLGFSGSQEDQFNQFSTVLNGLKVPSVPWGITLAQYSTDPVFQGPFDTSDSLTAKTSEEVVKKWLHSF